jgi:carbon storage regulator
MLVLTRKLMEKLYIGDEICVTVVRLEGGQVRLGIDAPRHIPVVRAELSRSPESRPPGRRAAAVVTGDRENPDFRIPPAEALGIDIRRRARSR